MSVPSESQPGAAPEAQRSASKSDAGQSVCIFGLGMMGASLALALRKRDAVRGETTWITGVVRSERSAKIAREQKLADEVLILQTGAGDPAAEREALRGLQLERFDWIVIGLPVQAAADLAAALPPLPVETLITDMSSTRARVQAAFADRIDELAFVGSHPMCGSENRGPGAAVENLYTDRLCIITALSKDAQRTRLPADGAERVEAFWQSIGMRTFAMDAADHDRVLARLSHGPHVLAGLLATWALRDESVRTSCAAAPMPVTGGGFKDMTRIAGSNPEMWRDILATNQQNLARSLREFRDELDRALALLDRPDFPAEEWEAWFREARRARNILCGYPEDA